ncbi:cation:proton antiporter [Noviherbaspirillum saxi]|uniref:Sodium:proton antiporter n=1 Tax=Noviherbaspirillum saxi TaxID=2320863 RepID=A0A3A3FKV7_9BURK|nr:cation:proton antiporter [Noviherbaspirillum saxi]RJF96158.1 sodium:proton antiporter [Noviherbaspirillum saxi]
MTEFFPLSVDFVWPLAVAVAWILGELVHRGTNLPRISIYSLTGMFLSYAQTGLLPRPSDSSIMLIANMAFGLILFEFAYRINLRWLRTNWWIAASGVVESVITFVLVYVVVSSLGMQGLPGLLVSALAVSTSPAEVLRVVNEQRSSGQVTERVLHMAALNCFFAVFVFNLIVGLWSFQSSGSIWGAVSNSLLVLGASCAIGVAFGYAVPALLRKLGTLGQDATIAFAIAVILLAALAQTFKVSAIVATLSFGFVVRHRRVTLGQAQRNFGVLGDLLTVLLFVFIGATLAWPRIVTGVHIALALLAARFMSKLFGAMLFARLSGTTWRKGALTGIAMSPMSVLVIGLLVQTRSMGVDLMDQLAPLAAATLLLAVFGPVLTLLALRFAGETSEREE